MEQLMRVVVVVGSQVGVQLVQVVQVVVQQDKVVQPCPMLLQTQAVVVAVLGMVTLAVHRVLAAQELLLFATLALNEEQEAL
jgi:hypothetical protein